MITTAPLPNPLHLLALRYLDRPDGNVLGRPWLRDGDLGGLWMSRSAWSLAVLADTFTRARGRCPVVAVPDYICNQSLWPLRRVAELVFYPVDDSLCPDWQACRDLPRIDMFTLVHYFGWPNDVQAARQFCDRRGAWLIEDAAHVLRPVPGVGEVGDAVLYSPHKLLPVPDGALLVATPRMAAVEAHLVEALRAAGWGHPHTTGWLLRKLVQVSPFGPMLMRRRPGGQPDFESDPPTLAMERTPMPSGAAASLIARADLDAVADIRAANAQALADAVTPLAPWVPLFAPQDGLAPYRLVMRCTDAATASGLYARLRAAHLPVESWPDLAPEVPATSAARRLRSTLLLLACHQGCRTGRLVAAYEAALA